MDSKNITFTIKVESQTIDRLKEVAEYLQEQEKGGYANRTAAIKYLFRLGYHTHVLLTAEKNPNIEPELLRDVNQLAEAIHSAHEQEREEESDDKNN